MTTLLSVALAEMRRQFADQLGSRIAAIREQFALIDIGAPERAPLETLHRLVHGLTGSAGTFGMQTVSDASRTLEQKLLAFTRDESVITPAEWEETTSALQRLEKLASIRLDSDAPSLQAPSTKTAPRTTIGALIHVVEDNIEQAGHIAEMLKAHGYPVRIFSSPADFLAACGAGETPSAVVMDMIFADDVDAGAKAIASLRESQGDCPPVVFLSVRDDTTARLAAYRAGASRYFAKPVNPERLVHVLNELTGRMPPQSYRVLLVDDDPLLVQAQAAILKQHGMEVLTLTDPLDTLDTLVSFKPDVLVLDVYMPNASGPEIAAIIREQDVYTHLPILFLSGESDMSKQLLALNLGGDDFLVKPVQPAHLVAAVTARARRARKNEEMMAQLRTVLYEREREHLALNHHAIVSIADSAGNITYANEKLCEVSGYSAEELFGRNHRILKSGQHPPAFYADMWRTISGGNIWHGEICNRKKHGGFYWVESTITPFLDADGRPYQYVAIRTEITTLKNRETELEEARLAAEGANRAKSDFLSSMSHELRTPMNAILGFAQLLEFDDTLSANQQEEVKEILKAGRHLLELINEVLDLAKVESGRIDLSLEAVELHVLADECIGLVNPLAQERGIAIAVDDLGGKAMHGDRMRLRQVLINLLSNAIKYNRDGGSVRISARQTTPALPHDGHGTMRLAVTDTGPGIAAERMGELFQPFHRLEEANSTVEGTGIGLVITRRLVEMMGGAVGAESTVGQGSTFWFELPADHAPGLLAPAPGEESIAKTGDGAAAAGQEHSVLYIEDNPANLRLVAQILSRRANINLVTAHAPQLGIELAWTHRPDLILLDINMPDMNGFQVMEILKADPRTQNTPVIAITANAMPRDVERGVAAGFVEYLTKPLDVERFLAAVDRCLERAD